MRNRLLVLAILLSSVPDARAEYALLRNGQRLHITGYERQGGLVRLHLPGGRVEIPATELEAIEPEDFFPPAARAESTLPYGKLIREAAALNGLEEELLTSVIAAESDFNPNAISRKNARGLMQLMPETAAELGVRDAFDPAQNIHAGARYLKQLLTRYPQDLRLALAAYNAGPDRVEQYKGVPPFGETRDYVRRVIQEYELRKASLKN